MSLAVIFMEIAQLLYIFSPDLFSKLHSQIAVNLPNFYT